MWPSWKKCKQIPMEIDDTTWCHHPSPGTACLGLGFVVFHLEILWDKCLEDGNVMKNDEPPVQGPGTGPSVFFQDSTRLKHDIQKWSSAIHNDYHSQTLSLISASERSLGRFRYWNLTVHQTFQGNNWEVSTPSIRNKLLCWARCRTMGGEFLSPSMCHQSILSPTI